MTASATTGVHRSLRPRRRARLIAVGAVGVAGGAVLAATVAYAVLTAAASNTTPQSVNSGVLSLSLTDSGAGFTSAVAGLAPGDVVNRYVDLTNNGTIDGNGLTLGVTATTSNALVTDATNGLQLVVSACPGGTWNTTTGVCSTGAATVLLAGTGLQNLVGAGSPSSLAAGAFAHGSTLHLQVSMALPSSITETVLNGVLPASSIQNLTTALTYTFREGQRAGVTTNS
jgi:hypothetical protein